MKAEVVETAHALLDLTLSYCMWHSLAEERDAERFYVREAAGAMMPCRLIFSFLCPSASFHYPYRNLLNSKAEFFVVIFFLLY